MAQLKSVLGQITGDLGDLTFRKWKNKNVLARKPSSYNDANTNAQQAQKSAFAQLVSMARRFLPVIRVGFASYSASMSEFNYFIKKNIPAFTKSGSSAVLDHVALKISQGPGEAVAGLAATHNHTSGALNISWDTDALTPQGGDDDAIYLLAWNKTTDEMIYKAGTKTRSQGSVFFDLAATSGDTVCIYAFAVQASDGSVSDSVHAEAQEVNT